jgi:hypothetical protein
MVLVLSPVPVLVPVGRGGVYRPGNPAPQDNDEEPQSIQLKRKHKSAAARQLARLPNRRSAAPIGGEEDEGPPKQLSVGGSFPPPEPPTELGGFRRLSAV